MSVLNNNSEVQPGPDLDSWRRRQGQKILERYSSKKIRALVKEYNSPVLLLSLKSIRRQYQTLQRLLPRVKHHYALKPLPHPQVVRTVRELGGYFDLATNKEVDIVRELGVDPKRCIQTHPIKRPSDVKYALTHGVNTFVFDNEYELTKMAPFKNKVKLLMRLSFPNPEAQCNLSSKFGVAPDDSLALLKKAVKRGFTVIGIAFHVGSQMKTPAKHLEAIQFSRKLIDQAEAAGIDTMYIIDLGGGWPISYVEPAMPIEDFIAPIRESLDTLFPDFEIFSEPGRFVAGPAVTLVCSVMGRSFRNGSMMYYLDDGIYNSYSGILFDHGNYLVYSLKELEDPTTDRKLSSLAGPTCDSIDIMYHDIMLPSLKIGDIIVSPCMGAYAGASHATDFNSFIRPKVIVAEE